MENSSASSAGINSSGHPNLSSSISMHQHHQSLNCSSESQRCLHQEQYAYDAVEIKSTSKQGSTSADHVLAERKRRERLNQQFIALSANIPTLKKLDKASVLGGAINYLKQLEERVESLEEEVKGKEVQSVVSGKRSRASSGDDFDEYSYSSEEKSEDTVDQRQPLPEIELRTCERDVMIRIFCEKHPGIMKEIFGKIEQLNLLIMNSSMTTFGDTGLHVTIIAQMDDQFCMTSKELGKKLRRVIFELMKN